MAKGWLDDLLNSGAMTTLGAAMKDPLGAVAQSYLPQSALDRAYEGNVYRETPGEFAQTALTSAGNIVGSPGALVGSMVENVSGSPTAGLIADIATPDPGDLAKVGAAALPMLLGRKAEIPQGFAEEALGNLEKLGPNWNVIPSAVKSVEANRVVEDLAVAAGKKLDELTPRGTVFNKLMKKMFAPSVGGSAEKMDVAGYFPSANKLQVGTKGFQEGVTIDDLEKVFNHEKFHSYWAQITNLAAKGDPAAKYAQDKFTKVLADVTGFRRPGGGISEALKRGGLEPLVDKPHTPKNVSNVSAKEALEEYMPKLRSGVYEKAAKYREGERLSDLFALLQTPQGRAELGPKILNELSGIFDFSGGTKAGPGYQKGGKVPDFMELLQLLLNPPQGQTQFQSGGMVPNATFRMPTADLMKMAQGGPVPPPEPLIPNVASTAQNYNPNVEGSTAQASTVGQTAQNVSQFNPFQGQGANTLNQMLSTGRPTNVAPITEAAISEGEQFFNEQLGGINEQMGAFGLSSSTARTGAIADALSKIGTNIGNEGLRAGVGAQESAANRSAGALSPFFAGTGQQLGAQTAGLQGQLGAGNLLLGGEQAAIQGQLGAMGNLTNLGLGLAPIQNQQMNQVPQGLPRTAPAPMASAPTIGLPNFGSKSSVFSRGPGASRSTPAIKQFGSYGGGLHRMASGGSVPRSTPDKYVANQGSGRTDFGDYMSNLLYGQKFNRMVPEEIPQIQLPRVQAPQFIQPQAGAVPNFPGGGLSKVREDSPADYAVKMMKWAANMKPWNTSGMPMDPFTGQGFRGGMSDQAMREALTILQGRGSGGGGPASQMPGRPPNTAEMMKLVNLAAGAPAQQGSQAKQEGGYIDGPSVPPDQVPILAQGGEGVIPVKMMAELEKSKSSDPLIQKLQDLMGFACGGKVGKYEKGGKVKKAKPQKMQSGGRPGPYQMLQDPSLYEEAYGQLPSPEMAQAALLSAIMANKETPKEEKDVSMSPEPKGKGNASVMESSVTFGGVPLAGPLSQDQKRQKIIDDAARRMSLIQSAMVLDPQGGGIQQTGPGDIARQQEIIQQQQAAQAATEQAKAQVAYGQAVGGSRAPVESSQDKRTQKILDSVYGNLTKENPNTGGVWTREELDQIAVQQLEGAGLPVPPELQASAAQGAAMDAGGLTSQMTGQPPEGTQQPTPEQMFGQWFAQGGDITNMPPETRQAFIQWLMGLAQQGLGGEDVRQLLNMPTLKQ